VKTKENQLKPHIGVVNFEKRKYRRFNIDLPLEYSRLHSPVNQRGRTINVSEGGLLIYFSEKLEIGQLLKLKLFFPSDPSLNTIEAVAEVVWQDIHLGEGWGDYRLGVKFTDISAEDMTKLRTFLAGLAG
jgi:c-di-GMP-binding flagellar brake protein YcgR